MKRAPRLADDVAAALRGAHDLVTYPPQPGRRGTTTRIIVKGRADLPAVLASTLGDLRDLLRAAAGAGK